MVMRLSVATIVVFVVWGHASFVVWSFGCHITWHLDALSDEGGGGLVLAYLRWHRPWTVTTLCIVTVILFVIWSFVVQGRSWFVVWDRSWFVVWGQSFGCHVADSDMAPG
jgi:hypothetical protein